jgi:hypothetical protein
MNAGHAPDPLDNPEYLRKEAHRVHKIIRALSDPEIKKELAAYSFYLAQRAEALSRMNKASAIIEMSTLRHRSAVRAKADQGGQESVLNLRRQSEDALDTPSTLRELAAWYRMFAEKAGNPAIWEARLNTAEDLEAEADWVERSNTGVDPNHGKEPTGD